MATTKKKSTAQSLKSAVKKTAQKAASATKKVGKAVVRTVAGWTGSKTKGRTGGSKSRTSGTKSTRK